MESRREFIKKISSSWHGTYPLWDQAIINNPVSKGPEIKCPVCIFSKHLQILMDYGDMADARIGSRI